MTRRKAVLGWKNSASVYAYVSRVVVSLLALFYSLSFMFFFCPSRSVSHTLSLSLFFPLTKYPAVVRLSVRLHFRSTVSLWRVVKDWPIWCPLRYWSNNGFTFSRKIVAQEESGKARWCVTHYSTSLESIGVAELRRLGSTPLGNQLPSREMVSVLNENLNNHDSIRIDYLFSYFPIGRPTSSTTTKRLERIGIERFGDGDFMIPYLKIQRLIV